jgi:hypothetical protein
MSSAKRAGVLLTHDEALIVRELLDSPKVAFAARNARLIGGLYAKLPELPIQPPPGAPPASA